MKIEAFLRTCPPDRTGRRRAVLRAVGVDHAALHPGKVGGRRRAAQRLESPGDSGPVLGVDEPGALRAVASRRAPAAEAARAAAREREMR